MTPPAGEPTRSEDIAQALEWLLYSSDPVAHKVERLIVEQQREIEAMRKAVDKHNSDCPAGWRIIYAARSGKGG
jgi:hypothetical protein